jgi:AcrR family transcriptional regulator
MATRGSIARAYHDLMLESDFRKLTVSRITDACGISRKTFYYHFADQAQLIQWVFRYELSSALSESCAKESLVFPQEAVKEAYPHFAYFARQVSGLRSLDETEFFAAFAAYLQDNRRFFQNVLSSSYAHSFLRYVARLYQQAFYEDILFVLGGRDLDKSTAAQLAIYFANAGVMCYFSAIKYSNVNLEAMPPCLFANITQESLRAVIEGYFQQPPKERRLVS